MKTVIGQIAIAICMSAVFVGQSQAKETWLPTFDSTQRVQIDPGLARRSNDAVALDSEMTLQLESAARKHNLAVYVVITEQGDELSGDRSNWAADMLHNRLWGLWHNAANFPKDRFLLICYIRCKDSDAGSIAARTSEDLHALGVTRDRLYQSSGPVLRDKSLMRSNPQKGIVKIVSNVNEDIDNHIAGKDPSAIPDWVIVLLIIIAVIVVVIIIACIVGAASGNSGGFFFFGGCSGGCTGGGGGGCGGGGCGGGGSC